MRRSLLVFALLTVLAVATCTEFDGASKLLGGGGSGGATSATSGGAGDTAGGGSSTDKGGSSTGKGGASSSHGGASSAGGQGPGGGSPCPMADDPCDCDGDHHRALRCDGGDDCDDNDPRVFPGQTNFFGTPAKGEGDAGVAAYDFNCDGKGTPQNTTSLKNCMLTACPAAMGWKDAVPACGETGEMASCTGLCQISDLGSAVQTCN